MANLLGAGPIPGGSGPRVARTFQIALSLTFLVAWLSLGSQVEVLIGSRGLLPFESLIEILAERRPDLPFAELPTWLRFLPSDFALRGGVALGVLLSLMSLVGVAARPAFALNVFGYLGYVVACREFLAFQWDNLLLELGALAVFLPGAERARFVHFCFRIALFKLYFESGLAKYQSHLGDWHDGSAMTFYYETAPLPTPLAWYAHHLPEAWHRVESWFTLAFELGVPWLAFAGRRPRLACFGILSAFQLVNIATANYGFFSYLALALGLFLLDDRDIEGVGRLFGRLLARWRSRAHLLRWPMARTRLARRRLRAFRRSLTWSPRTDEGQTAKFIVRLGLATLLGGLYLSISLFDGIHRFWPEGPDPTPFPALRAAHRPFRLVNTYHLFGHITRDRIEATFETFDGTEWTAHDLHYKPGDPSRPPPFVAPHQPRVDFQLWFYGLRHDRPPPSYVHALLSRLCDDPEAVSPLFRGPLPEQPVAARVAFYQYAFTTPEDRRRTGRWWTREDTGAPRARMCRAP
jgi:lipase maturation factor 1